MLSQHFFIRLFTGKLEGSWERNKRNLAKDITMSCKCTVGCQAKLKYNSTTRPDGTLEFVLSGCLEHPIDFALLSDAYSFGGHKEKSGVNCPEQVCRHDHPHKYLERKFDAKELVLDFIGNTTFLHVHSVWFIRTTL